MYFPSAVSRPRGAALRSPPHSEATAAIEVKCLGLEGHHRKEEQTSELKSQPHKG